MRSAIAAVLFCCTLLAADVTGTWSGTVTIKRDGGDSTDSAHLILKQQGSALTGSIGVHAGDQRPVANGKVQEDQVTFDVSTDNGSFKVTLKVEGVDALKGEVRRDGDGNAVVAQLELKRQK
jgi:hypothetical protein